VKVLTMSYDAPTINWEIEDIDKMLEMITVMEAPDFVPYTYTEPKERIENGVRITELPYPKYHEVVHRF
jgi:hypothetical protein